MKDLPWFTIATMLTALSTTMQGLTGDLPSEWAASLTVAAVVIGGFGKVGYEIAMSMQGDTDSTVESLEDEE